MVEEYKFSEKQPAKDFFWVFHNKDNKKIYYYVSINDYYRYNSLYGMSFSKDASWSYSSDDNCEVFGNCED